jgi:phospholipid-binding lipoprotein MlaA
MVVMAAACLTLAGCAARFPSELDVRLSDTRIAPHQDEFAASDSSEGKDYDPWEPVNEQVFSFNHDLVDRYGMKPVATAWAHVLPDLVTQGLLNVFDNLEVPKRFVNNVLQGRFQGANRELTRFLVNSTVGVAGVFDVASSFGMEKSYADFGQTLGAYGMGPGPYLMVPFLQPLTLRDGIGYGVDSLLDPIGYFVPFFANIARSEVKRVNERAHNLALYQDVEESSLDLYASVRNGYLQRRKQSIEKAVIQRDNETEWSLLRGLLSDGNVSIGTADDGGDKF